MPEFNERPAAEQDWKNKREIIQEIQYPEFWSLELAKKWVKEVPENLESEEQNAPVVELDLTKEGFGKIFVKNEADRRINPTGTMKDHMARECASQYGYQAKMILEYAANDPRFAKRLQEMPIVRYSILTAGNAGMALARAFESLNLPPPKLLLDKHTSPKIIATLKNSSADIYLADLSTNPFTRQNSVEDPLDINEILQLTNNHYGKDLTSNNSVDDYNPQIAYYQNLAKQIFSERPDEIYVPYGSGALFGEILLYQRLAEPVDLEIRPATESEKEFGNYIKSVKIFGAEPLSAQSIADKLSAPAKPFPTMWEKQLGSYKQQDITHPETGIQKLSEEEIKAGYELLKNKGRSVGIETEPSASAGFALYMKHWQEGKINNDAKIIIINTGKGIISDGQHLDKKI